MSGTEVSLRIGVMPAAAVCVDQVRRCKESTRASLRRRVP